MPLRDHFRPPLDDRRHWEGMHGGWPMMIIAGLGRVLPPGYFAEPRVHTGKSAEIGLRRATPLPIGSGGGNR